MKRFKFKTKKTKYKKIKRVLIGVSIVVLIFVSAAWAVTNNVLGKISYKDLTIPPDAYTDPNIDDVDPDSANYGGLTDEEMAALGLVPDSELMRDKDVINILLLGVDARKGENVEKARSDSMIIVSINEKEKKITMISVMRDLAVVIPGRNTVDKMNAAHAYGGPGLAVKTIEGNLGIKIDYFIRVDFFAFMDIVDILGGVEINVTAAERQVMNDYVRSLNREDLHLPDTDGYLTSSGLQRLTGKQALAYARVRYVGNGDFDRTGRQRKVLDQVFAKMKESSATQLLSVVNVIAPYVTTNMTKNQLAGMVILFLNAKNWPMSQGRIPVDGSWRDVNVRGMMCLSLDTTANRAYLIKELYGV